MRRGTPRLYNNNNIYKMKILLFDNYDSFTYNLLHILKELGADVEVHRNDKISLEEIERFDKILLSPGPGIPCLLYTSASYPELFIKFATKQT